MASRDKNDSPLVSNSDNSSDSDGEMIASKKKNITIEKNSSTVKKRKVVDDDDASDEEDTEAKKRKTSRSKKEEDSSDKDSSSSDTTTKKKSSKNAKSSMVEEEASESDDSLEDIEDSDDEDDEENNTYEKDGFIVDDEESEEQSSNDDDDDDDEDKPRRKKKEKKLKRLKQQREEALDDEDIALIKENLGMETNEADIFGSDSEEEDDENEKGSKLTKESKKDLSRQMFGDSDSEEEEPKKKPSRYMGDEGEYDSDDIDEFIVDDGDGRSTSRGNKSAPSSLIDGTTAYQMEEAEELFGDVDSFLEATRGSTTSTSSQVNPQKKKEELLDRYEPSVLEEHMMTDELEKIRKKDYPERYQYLFEGRKFPSAEDRSEEAEWITDLIFPSLKPTKGNMPSRGELMTAIDSILKFYHQDHLEPPFVREYCKEHWKYAGLSSCHLYEILEYDIKWDKMERKKASLLTLLERTTFSNVQEKQNNNQNTQDDDSNEDHYKDNQLLISQMKDNYRIGIKSSRQNDLKDYAELLQSENQNQNQNTNISMKLKRPARRGFYRICQKAGLKKLSCLFTISLQSIGNALISYNRSNAVLDIPNPEETPLVLAEKFVCDEFPLKEDVLKGVRHLAAFELSNEPNIKRTLRDIYRQNANLSTTATSKGREEIDEFHYCHGYQYLEYMSLMNLYGNDIFLRLVKAEKDEMINIKISCDINILMEPLEKFYLIKKNKLNSWDLQRHQILEEAIMNMILPGLEMDLRTELHQSAKQLVVRECGLRLKERLMIRPYTPRDGSEACVIGVWVDSDRDCKAHFVALDENGELVDTMIVLIDRSEERIRLMTSAIMKFISQQPRTSVVVVNTCSGLKCLDMVELIDGIRVTLQRNDETRNGNEDGKDYLHVTLLQDDVPRMYSRSLRAEKEFPHETEGIKASISLARYLQSPICEIAGLWGFTPLNAPERGKDLLHLSFHPLQKFVGKEVLLEQYNQIFVEVVNIIGVDINLAVNHMHCAYPLQFISGLGPVKAKALVNEIRRIDHIEKRQDFMTNHIFDEIIYRNAIGFLRIRERDELKESALNPLDDTRIHPESYFMAVKMCADANNNASVDCYNPDSYSYVVEDTMYQSASEIKTRDEEDVEKRLGDNDLQDALSELDLHAYATRLEQEGKGLKLNTLEKMKKELRYPFFDKRKCFQDPSVEDVFFLINGETKDSLQLGMILPCTLLSTSRDFVRVRLESGIRASLRKKFLPDYLQDVNYIRQFGFPRGLVVNAKVLLFQRDSSDRYYQVALGCDEKSIRNINMSLKREMIPSYQNLTRMMTDYEIRLDKIVNHPPIEETQQETFDKNNKKSSGSRRKKRIIAHPAFLNVNCNGAISHLKQEPVGEAVFRPSSLGNDHMTLTWKVQDGIYRHYVIEEKDVAPGARMGSKLIIKDETFEDLDEILARFIGSMNVFIDDVMNHKNFRSGTKDQIIEELKAEKQEQPARIPYFFHFASKYPGCFTLSFLPSRHPRTFYFETRSNGYKFFGHLESPVLKTLNHVLSFFKKNALSTNSKPKELHSESSSRPNPRPNYSSSYDSTQRQPFSSSSSSYNREEQYSNDRYNINRSGNENDYHRRGEIRGGYNDRRNPSSRNYNDYSYTRNDRRY